MKRRNKIKVVKSLQIYTKAGDKGKTRIIGQEVVSKDDARVNAYGSVDELNSWVGYTASQLSSKTAALKPELEEIQQLLFDAGTILATAPTAKKTALTFDAAATQWLEKKIDHYTEVVPPVKKFILPGGSQTAGALHVARTITRRTERAVVTLQGQAAINPAVLVFINRLSDYFFAAARYANSLEGKTDVLYRNSRPVFH